MRLTQLAFMCVALVATPAAVLAAGRNVSVRAIAFVASNERGATDRQLAPYEGVLRANLRFESFHYVGESSGSVGVGGTAALSCPSGRIEVRSDPSGSVSVRHRGTTVAVSPGRPAVFLGGATGKGKVSGVIVLVQ